MTSNDQRLVAEHPAVLRATQLALAYLNYQAVMKAEQGVALGPAEAIVAEAVAYAVRNVVAEWERMGQRLTWTDEMTDQVADTAWPIALELGFSVLLPVPIYGERERLDLSNPNTGRVDLTGGDGGSAGGPNVGGTDPNQKTTTEGMSTPVKIALGLGVLGAAFLLLR